MFKLIAYDSDTKVVPFWNWRLASNLAIAALLGRAEREALDRDRKAWAGARALLEKDAEPDEDHEEPLDLLDPKLTRILDDMLDTSSPAKIAAALSAIPLELIARPSRGLQDIKESTLDPRQCCSRDHNYDENCAAHPELTGRPPFTQPRPRDTNER